MLKLASKLLFGLSILALGAPLAHAGQANFFDLLFGARRHQNQQTFAPPPRQVPWWQQGQGGDQTFAPERTSRKKKFSVAGLDETADPEFQLPGLGMGTVNYLPPVVAPVFDPSFATLQGQGPEAEAIRSLLIDRNTPIKAVEAERKAVAAFYKSNGFKPMWVEAGHLNSKATEVLKVLASAPEDGMLAKNYLPEVLTSFTDIDAVASDATKQARLDVGLTLAALHYARHISGGQFDPNRLSLYNDIKPEVVNADEALKLLSSSEIPASYLQSLAPKHPQYALLKAELGKLNASGGAAVVPVAAGPTVKPGKTDVRLPAVRLRLEALGYSAKSTTPIGDEQKLDQDLAIGLMALQTANKLKPSGLLDGATVKLLNRDETGERRQKLVSSMERVRWLPKSLGERYVFVNQASYTVNVMDKEQVAWRSKVIVGQPTKQTYSFYDQISQVVFNPKWGVPVSIIINEYGPKMRKDPGYLDRNGFIVVDLKGEEIGSSAVDWYNISATPNFGIQQLAGGGNALGELKFLFPNAHDIYMHDTPTKNLFNDPVRAFSHGCVRVQNPREFAQVLLGWNKDQVVKGLAITDTHSVQLPQKVPVYLTYFTAWADDTGKLQFYDDIYGRDTALMKALAYDPAAKVKDPNALAAGTIAGGITQN